MPPYHQFGRNDAQVDARGAFGFPTRDLDRIVKVQAGRSTGAANLQVQDRYPSPLRLSLIHI